MPVAIEVTNIAAYKFAPLDDLRAWRERLRDLCADWQLKGTILLSPEGVNLFVAGDNNAVEQLLGELRSRPGLETLEAKYSTTSYQPFTRMNVKLKKEIIAFGLEGIDPARRPSPKISPATLKQWLDEGRDVTLLDTRNDYEVRLGTFRNALPIGISKFRDFPEAAHALPDEMRSRPIVMFCTGGIRCEKAGPFMERDGFQNIFQLDGGILKYFEECGSAHYDGECFVFDKRTGVDPALHESDSTLCYHCHAALTPDEVADVRYVEGESCPHCYVDSEHALEQNIAMIREKIRAVSTPLPGSQPAAQPRPIRVPAACDGMRVTEVFAHVVQGLPLETWIAAAREGRLVDDESRALTEFDCVRAGQRIIHLTPLQAEPPVNVEIDVLFADESILVLNKPAPLPMHAGGRFSRNTLQHILNLALAPSKPRPVHRLDANTSGVIVVARTRAIAQILGAQFTAGAVRKLYLARITGHPEADAFSCDAPISADVQYAGARQIDETNGQPARTEFHVISRDTDGTSLIEARPITGRTNQIRLHLAHLGFSIRGDSIYGPGDEPATRDIDAPPLCLHAQSIEFQHPRTGERVCFSCDPPDWSESVR